MRTKRKQNPRIVFLICLMLSIFMIFSFRGIDFQLISTEEFESQNQNLKGISTTVKASRGIIVDRYGRPIVTNREGYNVTLNSAYLKKADYNKTILSLCKILKDHNEEWNDVLPLTNEAPFKFSKAEDDKEVVTLKKKLGLNNYATVENCYVEMIKRYGLETYSTSEKRLLMGVRYSMERADFSVSNPFVLAEDISPQLMISLSESYTDILGVEITVSTYREYKDPELATQIIGTIGKIYAEEWEELSNKGYSYNDYVGKSGVEKAFESYLKGTDGKMTYYFDKSGNMVKSEITSQPKQGNTVYLTIDSKLQKVSQDILAKHIKKLNSQGSKITGGAVVVTKIDSGEVLASADYPTYSFDDYYNNYSSILSSPNNPLFDRAFKGTYPPGSVFKPLVAIAGLQENIIDRYSTIKCVEKYTYYQDYQPSCMHYHGTMNVISSISKSCNYFFFDCGRRVGITKLNNYSRIFGFGELTGVETSESAGVLAGPSYSSSIGSIWYDGQTLSAAIGQSDNSFTPLQLSTYTATIANGGTRYKTTLLNKVVSPSSKDVVFQNTPTVVAKSDVSANVIDIVKQGMLSVTSEGTASAYFADYPINIGGKTGTAQTTGRDNSVLIVFAPYEDPEIAISIVIEHGERSISTGPIVKAILDEYFFTSEESYQDVMPNVPLK